MAALTAGRAGADVILADEDVRLGGRLLAETEAVDGVPGAEWAAEVLAELEAMPNVRVMTRTTVTGPMTAARSARWSGWGCIGPRARICRASVSGGSWRSGRSCVRGDRAAGGVSGQ
jgi:hypothetical protein